MSENEIQQEYEDIVYNKDLERIQAYFSIAQVNINVGLHGSISTRVILLDSGADDSIFGNPDLVANIRETRFPIRLNGINNIETQIICRQQGKSMFGEVYFSDEITMNVLSLGKAVDFCHTVQYMEEDDEFFVLPLEGMDGFIFKRSKGSNLYTCDLESRSHRIVNCSAVTTVEERMAKYSKREVQRAAKAREYIRCMSSTASKLIKLINQNKIANCEVNPQDVARSVDIWGKDVFGMKGKTTRNIPAVYDREYNVVPKQVRKNQILYIDIMFVNGTAYLLGKTSPPLNFVAIERLVSNKTIDIFNKLKIIIDRIKSTGISVCVIRSDEESGVVSNEMRELLLKYDQAIDLDISPGGEAVGAIEREIRTLKERARALILSLPYACDVVLEEWLLRNRVYFLNWEPRETTVAFDAPYESLLGRTLDANKDFKFSFGEYVQFADGDTDNDINIQRARGAIALMPTGNRDGGWYFLAIETWKTVVRRDAVKLPIALHVIQAINQKASAKQLLKANQGETLKMGLWRDGVFQPLSIPEDSADYSDQESDFNDHMPPYIVPSVLETQEALDIINNNDIEDAYIPMDPPSVVNPAATSTGDVPSRDLLMDIDGIDNDGADTITDMHQAIHSDKDSSDNMWSDQPQELNSGDGEVLDFQPPEVPQESNYDPYSNESAQTESQDIIEHPQSRYNLRRGDSSKLGRWDRRTVGAIAGEPLKDGSSSNSKRKKVKRINVHQLTIRQAIDKLGDAAVDSIVQEIEQLNDRQSFEGVQTENMTPEERKRIISSSMFLKDKYTADGKFEKLKARLVAGGHQQDRAIYDESGSPTATTASIFIIATIAAMENRAVATIDFPGAYLNAEMPKDKGKQVFMKLNKFESLVLCKLDPSYESYRRPDGNMVVKLNRALYGCVESGRLWYEKLTKDLESIGYKKNPHDMCVFNRIESDGSQSTLIIHVDDMKITAKSEEHIDGIIKEIGNYYPKLQVHRGRVFNYLGMVFDYTEIGKCKITMPNFTDALLDFCADIHGIAPSPARNELFKVDENSKLLEKDKREFFHSTTQKLLYLGKRVRPEILPAVSFLTKRVQKPTEEDYTKLVRVIQYIRKYKSLGIVLEGNGKYGVYAYVDASFGVHPDMKSHTGSTISVGKGPIHCKSSTQKINTKSSTEAELVAVCDSSNQIIWTRNFLIAQGYDIKEATIFEDNKSTIEMVKNGKSNSDRTKHIAVRFYFIADRVSSKEVKLVYMPTEDMVADLLTKPMQGKQFVKFRRLLLNWYDDGDPDVGDTSDHGGVLV